MAALALRFHGEYREMPGLRLTMRQAARLFGVEADVAFAVLEELRRTSILALWDDASYTLLSEETDDVRTMPWPRHSPQRRSPGR